MCETRETLYATTVTALILVQEIMFYKLQLVFGVVLCASESSIFYLYILNFAVFLLLLGLAVVVSLRWQFVPPQSHWLD